MKGYRLSLTDRVLIDPREREIEASPSLKPHWLIRGSSAVIVFIALAFAVALIMPIAAGFTTLAAEVGRVAMSWFAGGYP